MQYILNVLICLLIRKKKKKKLTSSLWLQIGVLEMFEKVYLKEKYLHFKKKIYIKNRTDTLNILVLVVSLIVDLDNQTKSFIIVSFAQKAVQIHNLKWERSTHIEVLMIVIDAWCFHTTFEKTNKPCQITATMKNIIIVHYMQYLKDWLRFHIWSSTILQELLPDGQFVTV